MFKQLPILDWSWRNAHDAAWPNIRLTFGQRTVFPGQVCEEYFIVLAGILSIVSSIIIVWIINIIMSYVLNHHTSIIHKPMLILRSLKM